MALKLVDQGEEIFLKNNLNIAPAEDLDCRLFTNNHTPADTDTEADYVEATFPGYAAVQFDATQWVLTPGAPTQAVYPTITFERSVAGTAEIVYGYYITQRLSGKLIWAELFSDNDPTAPYSVQQLGDNIAFEPQITDRDETD